MKKFLKGMILYLVLSIIPLLFIGISAIVRHSMDSEFRDISMQILQDSGVEITDDMRQKVSYLSTEIVCDALRANIEPGVYEEVCVTAVEFKNTLSVLSVYAWLLIGLAFFAYTFNLLLGLVSRINRFALLIAFKIGTVTTFIISSILILGQCAFGIGIIYYLEAYYIGRIHVGLMFSIALAGGIASLVLLYNMFKMINKQIVVKGVLVTRQQQPGLWKMVQNVTNKMGTKLPDNIIVYFGDNYFVTQAPVVCYSGVSTGRTLVISLPCLYKFTEAEFKAILVHEFSHFQGLDTVYSIWFYSSWGRLSDAYKTVSQSNDIASLCTVMLLDSFMQCFVKPKAYFDRLREKRADLNAANLTSNTAIAGALVKLTLYSICWKVVEKEKIDARAQGKYIKNESIVFNIACDNLAGHKNKNDLIKDYLNTTTNIETNSLDEHPCLKDRLEYVGICYNKAEELLKATKSVPAIKMFDNLLQLEEELSKYDAM